MIFTLFFIFGTIFGSFSTVLIERWHSGKGGIMLGRSECPHCEHKLSIFELIPIFSYIFQNGKCHSCKRKISLFYPIAEILFGMLFLVVGIFILRSGINIISIESGIVFFLGFVTGLYILYDARYMEVPDQIMVPGIYLYLLLLIVGLFIPSIQIWIFDIYTYPDIHSLVQDHLLAALLIYTFFYIQILIPGSIFLLRKGRVKDSLSLMLSYFLFPILLPFEHLRGSNNTPSQIDEEEIPSWIGGGDLRIALFIGITLGVIHSIMALGVAYILGSLIGIFLLMKGGRKNSQISFGPFLGIGWIVSLLFHDSIIAFMGSF